MKPEDTKICVYDPREMIVEQITIGGTVSYLHHDQAGSTRLLTGSTGTVTGKCTYGAYGTATCEGATTTPLGYDAQYTSTDTGLIYLRNRVYDPSTDQFLTVDPLDAITHEPYSYAGDNPVNSGDPSGLGNWNPFSEGFWTEGTSSPKARSTRLETTKQRLAPTKAVADTSLLWPTG